MRQHCTSGWLHAQAAWMAQGPSQDRGARSSVRGKTRRPCLRAVGRVPGGDLAGDGALLDHGGAWREEAARGEHTTGGGDGQKEGSEDLGDEWQGVEEAAGRPACWAVLVAMVPDVCAQRSAPCHVLPCWGDSHLTGSLSPSMLSMGRTTFSRNSAAVREPVRAAACSPRPTRSCGGVGVGGGRGDARG